MYFFLMIGLKTKNNARKKKHINKLHSAFFPFSLLDQDFWEEFPDGKMNKEAFIKFYKLIKNDGQEPGNACEYIINRFND